MELEELRYFIEKNCFTANGSLNNYMCKDSWWKNRKLEIYQKEILDRFPEYDNIFQKIYHIMFENIRTTCKECSNNVDYLNYVDGYRQFCCMKCSQSSPIRSAKIVASTDHNEMVKTLRKTCIEKYGCNSFLQTEEFKKKSRETKLKRYGNPGYNASDRLTINIPTEYIAEQHFKYKRSYQEIAKELNVSGGFVSTKMMEAGYHGMRWLMQSSYERELHSYLLENNIDAIISDRHTIKKVELDVSIPSLGIAFEINGVHWHSENKKKHNFHLEKYNKARANGIRLISFTDREILDKKNIVYSIVNNVIGNVDKIDSKDCIISELTIEQYEKFLSENHIHGPIKSFIRYGLFHNNELISVFGMGKNKNNFYEIHRICDIINVNVENGTKTIFDYVINKFDIDFVKGICDKRFFHGSVYTSLGFDYIKDSKPDFNYTKNGKVYHKSEFKKEKLIDIFENYDEKLSEVEIMNSNGFYRIFDCGNEIYFYNKKNEE